MAKEEPQSTEMDIFCEDETVCPICSAEFIDVDDLQTHIRQVHEAEPQETGPLYQKQQLCRLCFEYFPSALDLALHIRDSHIINLKACAFCFRAFLTRQDLWKHEEKHNLNVSSMFACSECPMLFPDLTELEYHELNSHYEAPGMMLQPYYPELASVLRIHADRLMQRINKKTVFKCTCAYSTYDILEYVKHAQTKNCNCYTCNTCNKVFLTKKQIMRHVKNVDCERVKNYNIMKCPNCFLVVAQKDVKNHRRRCKAVRCNKCKLQFGSVDALSEHKLEKHSKKSVLVKECRYCCKSLVGLEMFKQHVIKKHKMNYLKYKYNCVYCKKIFDHPQNLFSHFHSRHRTLRPFVCNLCDKSFALRYKFTYHIKLAHQSKGFIEFTKNLNVHFNAVKSPNAVILTPPASLFTPQEENEFKSNGIEIFFPLTKTATSSKEMKNDPRVIKKARRYISVDNQNTKADENDINEDKSTAIQAGVPIESEQLDKTEEVKETEQQEEPAQTAEYFESSDDEPIKKKRRKKGTYSKRLICNICEQKCYTIENYNRHMNGHKSNKGLKECLKCNKKFKTTANLISHIQQRHTTSLIQSLKTMVAKRKQTSQIQVPIPRKEKFICNIQKVYIEPDYRPSAQVQLYKRTEPPAPNDSRVDKVLLKILSESRVSAKKRPQIVMKKCVFDETEQPPEKGIKMQRCDILDNPINYEPANLQPYRGPIEKSKFDLRMSSLHSANCQQEDYYYEDDIMNFEDVETNNEDIEKDHVEVYNEPVITETKSIKPELFMLPSAENNLTGKGALLIPNEQTKKFGKLNVATLYYTETGQAAYKIVPFKFANEEKADSEEEEVNETQELPGGPKLVQSNPLAHLMGSKKLTEPKLTGKNYYKKKLQNPQLKIAQALMELKMPHTRKRQIRFRTPKGKHIRKVDREDNADAFKYEILDDDAENWAMVSED